MCCVCYHYLAHFCNVRRVVFKKDEKDGEKKQIPQSQMGKR